VKVIFTVRAVAEDCIVFVRVFFYSGTPFRLISRISGLAYVFSHFSFVCSFSYRYFVPFQFFSDLRLLSLS